jgi:hypothetical protein
MWVLSVGLIAIAIVLIAALTIQRIIRERRSGFPLKDERTEMIQGRAAYYTFFVGTYYMILLNFYNIFIIEILGWPELGSLPALNSTLILMGLTFLGLQKYFEGKEDMG